MHQQQRGHRRRQGVRGRSQDVLREAGNVEQGSKIVALFGEAVENKGRQEIRGSEVGVEMMQLVGERLEIVRR